MEKSPLQSLFDEWFEEYMDALSKRLRRLKDERAAFEEFQKVIDKAVNQHYMQLAKTDPMYAFTGYVSQRFGKMYNENDGYKDFNMSEFLAKSTLAASIKEAATNSETLLSTRLMNKEIEEYEAYKKNATADKKVIAEYEKNIKQYREQIDKDLETVNKFFSDDTVLTIDDAKDKLHEIAKLFYDKEKLKSLDEKMEYLYSDEGKSKIIENPKNTMDLMFNDHWNKLNVFEKQKLVGQAKEIMFDGKNGRPRSVLDLYDADLRKYSPEAVDLAIRLQLTTSVVPELMKNFDKDANRIFSKAKNDYQLNVYGREMSTKEILKQPILYSLTSNEKVRDTLNDNIKSVEYWKNLTDGLYTENKDVYDSIEKAEKYVANKEKTENINSQEVIDRHKQAKQVAAQAERGVGNMSNTNKSVSSTKNAHRVPKARQVEEQKKNRYIPKHRSVELKQLERTEDKIKEKINLIKMAEIEKIKANTLKRIGEETSIYNGKYNPEKEAEEKIASLEEYLNDIETKMTAEISDDNWYLKDPKDLTPEQIEKYLKEMRPEQAKELQAFIEALPENFMREFTFVNEYRDTANEVIEKENENVREMEVPERTKEEDL